MDRAKITITMTPEEKFDNKVWKILQKIKEEILFGETHFITWRIQKPDIFSHKNETFTSFEKGEKAVLNKLQELGALKMETCLGATLTNMYDVDWNDLILYLKILQPKFDEIYKKYQALTNEQPRQHAPTNSTKIDEQFVGELNLHGYSEDNLQRISEIANIISSHLQLVGLNRLTELIKIPFPTLERKGVSYEEARVIIGGINRIYGDTFITIINEEPYEVLYQNDSGTLFCTPFLRNEHLEEARKRDLLQERLSTKGRFIGILESDLTNNLILQITAGQQDPIKLLNQWQKNIEGELAERHVNKRKGAERFGTDMDAIKDGQMQVFALIERKLGFLKFGKYGEKIKISGKDSQPFRLLQCLAAPFGVAKLVDTVFESIREGVKEKSKSGVYTNNIDKKQKITLIGYAIKELQKGNKLQNKIEVKWDELKTKYWLEYIG